MSSESLNLLFDDKKLDAPAIQMFGEATLEAAADKIKKAEREDVFGYVKSLVEPALDSILDISLADIFFGGWRTLRGLQKYATGDKLTADEEFSYSLGKHELTSTHEPVVALVLGEKTLCEVTVTIKVKFLVASANLAIRKGRVMRATLSGCKGSGELLCNKHSLLKRETRELDFPHGLSFGEGLTIPPPLWH